jgi:hypothetical protein
MLVGMSGNILSSADARESRMSCSSRLILSSKINTVELE